MGTTALEANLQMSLKTVNRSNRSLFWGFSNFAVFRAFNSPMFKLKALNAAKI